MTPITDLPVGTVDPEALVERVEAPAIGELVAVYTRGRVRVVRIVKVGPKRVTVEYTTPSAVEAAWKLAERNRTAGLEGEAVYQERLAARYEAEADVVEELDLATDEWVRWADQPEAYRKVARKPGNVIQAAPIYPPAQLREWAAGARRGAEAARGKVEAAKAYDARPTADKAAELVHMTTKVVARDQVWKIPA